MEKRVSSIDFFRGIAALSVIMIHTVFHSGNSYVPANVSGCFLLIDIPIFLYLTRLLYAYKESPKKKLLDIWKLLKKWIIFCVICYIFLSIVDKENIFYKDFVSWVIFSPNTISPYTTSIIASIGFMRIFIMTNIICSVLLYFLKNGSKKEEYFKNVLYILLFMFFMLLTVNDIGGEYFGLNATVIGYCIFFLLGFISYKFKFKNFKQFLVIELILNLIIYILFHVNGFTTANIQSLKSSMNYLYVLLSLNSIFIIIFLKDRINFDRKLFKPINYIGKNAFYMYFAQGISSSILYFIEPNILINNLALKIIIMFIINLCIALTIFVILLIIYKIIDNITQKSKNIIMKRKLNYD